ncbi:ATP-binding protein [Proteiniborus sp. DW1]|uniref:ATP-binding protein n=1 Tax=Proteiniborus sp. DW1 TaxID=1889883 RepID=UPI00241E9FC1|nr:ATP-binding protein [Proteiniborus sp. DW1]
MKDHAKELNLNYLRINADKIIEEADLKDYSYQDILIIILENEIELRDKKAQERRLKNTGFPVIKKIEDFDLDFQKSIPKKQVNRLLEMEWIDRIYNLTLLGAPIVIKEVILSGPNI